MVKIAISKESDHTHPSLSLDVSKFDVNERGIDEKSTQDSVLEEVQRELEVELSRGRKLENLIITAPVSEASGFKQVVATQTIFWGVTPKIGGK